MNALDGRNVSITPQPDVKNITVQQNIQSLIQAGRLNDAFQTALSSNDLALVVFTCELLNTTQVVNSCQLPPLPVCAPVPHPEAVRVQKAEVKHAWRADCAKGSYCIKKILGSQILDSKLGPRNRSAASGE